MEYLLVQLNKPKEITDFLNDVFEIYEIRQRVGKVNGIVFQIRSNEQNHTIPHVHAAYGEYNISVEIETGKVLAGNLPKKNERIAVDWVLSNRERLLREWRNIAISANSTLTNSALDFR